MTRTLLRCCAGFLIVGALGVSQARTASSAAPAKATAIRILSVSPLSHPLYSVQLEVQNAAPTTCILDSIELGRGRKRSSKRVRSSRMVDATAKQTLGVTMNAGELRRARRGIRATCAALSPAVKGVRAIAKAHTHNVAPGGDILVRLHLEATDPPARRLPRVWDTKYSFGYRSWWFRVKTPDGKLHILRRAVVPKWSKNAPRPVTIAPGKPYVLEGWGAQHGNQVAGQNYFSLRKLGLTTTLKGRYEITGMFEQQHQPYRLHRWKKYWGTHWMGALQSNTVVVTVR